MVRQNTLKTKILSGFAFSLLAAPLFFSGSAAHATCTLVNGTSTCDDDANFQVKIPEVLTVSITRPNSWATGDIGVLLRNVITLEIVSNNQTGFAASMTTGTSSALSNLSSSSTSTIPLLTTDWTRSSAAATDKFWGYSTDDANETGTYKTIAAENASTPTTLIAAGTKGTASQNIYFGAKASSDIDSGTYQGTVIISVVSGVAADDPVVTPDNPVTPDDTTPNNPSYDNTTDRTAYADTTYSGTIHTSTLEVSEGDTTKSYQDPQGVTTATINEGTPLATGLAVTAVVAAVAGFAFFIVARRREEEEDDDEY